MTILIIVLIVILVILYFYNKIYFESFDNQTGTQKTPDTINKTNPTSSTEPLSILVFVSKSCGHCVNYNNNYHDSIVDIAKQKGISVKRIFSDNDPEHLFDKFNVMYVPTGFIMKGDQIYKNLGSNISPQSVKSALE